MRIHHLLIIATILLIFGCSGHGSPPTVPDESAPVAIAKADPNPQAVNFPVSFSASDSTDPDGGTIQLYEWDWNNDGTYDQTGENVDHTWIETGTYQVQLRLLDDEGITDILDDPLEITINNNLPPEACGEADPLTTVVCEPVHFTDCGSDAVKGAMLVRYEWDWNNDGTYDEQGADVYHTWDIPGTYLVMYRVTDFNGATDEILSPIEITVINALPSAVAVADSNPDVGAIDHFDGTGSYDNDCEGVAITKWEWDWDNDGTYDEEGAEVDHVWDFPGTYYVQLRVTDDEGETDLLDAPLEIIIQDFTFNPVDITPPWLAFTPYDIAIDGNYAYIAGRYGLHIFDISDPANPIWVNFVGASADDWRVDVSGGYAYMIGIKSLEIINIDPPESAYIVNSITLWEDDPHDIAVSGGYACVMSYSSHTIKIFDIDPPESAYVVSQVSTQSDYGLALAMSGGYAYFVTAEHTYIGGYYNSYYFLHIIEISPLGSAHIVNQIPVWYTRYISVSGGYAYLSESNGLRIIDIEPPESAYTVNSVNTGQQNPYGVAVSGGYAYLVAADVQESSLLMIDIDPPESAYIANTVDTPFQYLGRIAVSGGYAYATSRYLGLLVIDIEPLNDAYCAGAFYSLFDSRDVAVSGGYAYVADGYGYFKIVDIESPYSPYIVNAITTQIEDAQAVEVSNGYAYIADNAPHHEDQSLQIIDIDPPGSAYLVNEVTITDSYGVEDVTVSGGYAYAAMGASLQIIDIDSPDSAYIVNSVEMPAYANSVTVSGSYAYVTCLQFGLQIIDINPPESAYIVNTVVTEHANDVAVSGGYAYVADDYYGGLKIIDIDPPESAYIVNTVDTPGWALGVVVSGSYAYVADGDDKGLQIIDIDPPESAYIVDSVDTANARRVAVSGGYAYVADGYDGLRIIQLW
ncbi:MAG: PKD domain-containing protein [bacterium]|nr:PKD domain-containing protein [bacterium]